LDQGVVAVVLAVLAVLAAVLAVVAVVLLAVLLGVLAVLAAVLAVAGWCPGPQSRYGSGSSAIGKGSGTQFRGPPALRRPILEVERVAPISRNPEAPYHT
jgi:hypothetical protein